MANDDRDTYLEMTREEYEDRFGRTGDRRFDLPQDPRAAAEHMEETFRRVFAAELARWEAA